MQRVFEKIIEKLEKQADELYKAYCIGFNSDDRAGYDAYVNAIEIVKQEAAEYKNTSHDENIRKLLSGEWVDCDKVQEALRMSFGECFCLLDFLRTAEWWSIVGETEEERARDGQKITTKFRLKSNINGWVPCSERLPSDCAIHEVTAQFSNGKTYTEFAYYDESRDEWWKFDDDGLVNVVAWKEQSEPYQPNGE